MMNKAQSARVHLIRFLFLLPLLVVVLLAFRNSKQGHNQPLHAAVTDTIPTATQPPGWQDIETIDVNESKVTVRLKNKKIEKYDLSNLKEREAFESKYGPVPAPPPPPTPPVVQVDRQLPRAPKPPVKPELREAPEKPEAPVPPPPPPPVPAQVNYYNKKGYCITVVDNFGEAIVIVKNKDNKIVQAVSLTDWNNDKQFEEKYGEAPPRQIQLLPKRVMGYKATPVTVNVKPAAIGKDEEVVVVGKPLGIVSAPKPAVKLMLDKKVVLTPDNNYIIMYQAHHGSNVAAQAKEAAEAKATPAAETKVAAEAKAQANEQTQKAKAEEEAKKAAEAQPAAPAKEQ